MLEKEEDDRKKLAWIHVRYEMFVTGFLQALVATICTICYIYTLYSIKYTVYCSSVYLSHNLHKYVEEEECGVACISWTSGSNIVLFLSISYTLPEAGKNENKYFFLVEPLQPTNII